MTVTTISISPPQAPNRLNPLGKNTRIHLHKQINLAISDQSITSIILYGGQNFSAGADISEFAKSDDVASGPVPSLTELAELIEKSPKPIVAAMTGVALGGGCELALACHFRVAHVSSKIGLPEVKIGLIPGAGGTQRLPRVSKDVAWSLNVITTGRMVGAVEAKNKRVLDDIATNSKDVLDIARKWCSYAELMNGMTHRMSSNQCVMADDDAEAKKRNVSLCNACLRKVPPKENGGEALQAAIQAVRASFENNNDFQKGMEVEAELFWDLLLNSQQGRGLRHAFFAVRAANRISDKTLIRGPVADAFAKGGALVGVIGAGTMGSGIAICFLRAGCKVILVDNNAKGLQRGVRIIHKIIQKDVVKKHMTAAQAAHMLENNFSSTTDMSTGEFPNSVVVVEAVFENLKIKQSIFHQLDQVILNPKALLLSNTSTLNIDAIASALSPAKRAYCAGMHFFSPAHVMKLVEIVISAHTSPETTAIVQMITSTKLRKIGVTVGNCNGFVGNRMMHSYSLESVFILEEGGATVPEVDNALVNFGMAIGSLNVGDLAGNDIGYLISKEKGYVKDPKTGLPGPNRTDGMRYTDLADDLVVKLGRVGQKKMKGWYDYDINVGKGRKPIPSKEVEDFIKNHNSGSTKITTKYSKQEIVERVLFPLVNEGFKILEENIAEKPSDIDAIYLNGYGFPAYRGGPMFWIDNEIGLPYLLKRLQEMNHTFPGSTYYVPSKLLEKCVSLDISLEEYYKKGLHKENKSSLSKL